MTRRILLATVGGTLGAATLGLALVLSPWRPDRWWAAAVVLGLLLPVATAVGTSSALRMAGVPRHQPTARLTGISSVALTIAWQFALIAVFSTNGPGAQQVAAIVLGGGSSGALAARFTHGED